MLDHCVRRQHVVHVEGQRAVVPQSSPDYCSDKHCQRDVRDIKYHQLMHNRNKKYCADCDQWMERGSIARHFATQPHRQQRRDRLRRELDAADDEQQRRQLDQQIGEIDAGYDGDGADFDDANDEDSNHDEQVDDADSFAPSSSSSSTSDSSSSNNADDNNEDKGSSSGGGDSDDVDDESDSSEVLRPLPRARALAPTLRSVLDFISHDVASAADVLSDVTLLPRPPLQQPTTFDTRMYFSDSKYAARDDATREFARAMLRANVPRERADNLLAAVGALAQHLPSSDRSLM
jgi:hypothetical protein